MSRVSLAIDAGARRIGVARCDAGRIMALPVATVRRNKYGGHIEEILEVIDEYEVSDIFVGLPLHLSGREGQAARGARALAATLAQASGLPVYLVDERLTTVSAHAQLHAAGRDSRQHRQVVDQVSAVMLLELVIETERRTGSTPGELVE